MGNGSSAGSEARVFWCAVASLDTSGGVWRKGGGLGRWGFGVLLLVPVTIFLSLAPDIVWRGAVDGLVTRTGSRVEGRRIARQDV